MGNPQVDSYEYHLKLFLIYNERLVKRQWRNRSEEIIVRENEYFHCIKAAQKMPQELFVHLPIKPPNNMFPPQNGN